MFRRLAYALAPLWNLPAALRFARTYGPDRAAILSRDLRGPRIAEEAVQNYLDEMTYLLPRRYRLTLDTLEREGVLPPEEAERYRSFARETISGGRSSTVIEHENGTMELVDLGTPPKLPWVEDPSILECISPVLRKRIAELDADVATLRTHAKGFCAIVS